MPHEIKNRLKMLLFTVYFLVADVIGLQFYENVVGQDYQLLLAIFTQMSRTDISTMKYEM